MNIKNLTGVELLHNASLKNKILFKIPDSPFHILFTYKKKNKKWNVHAIQLASTCRKRIEQNISTSAVNKLILKLTKNPVRLKLKKTSKIKQFVEELKTLII